MTAELKVKVCGISRPEDALACADAGADFIGIIFAPSPRQVPLAVAPLIAAALPGRTIGVFVDSPLEAVISAAGALNLAGVQLHGNEDEPYLASLRTALPKILIIKAIRVCTTTTAAQMEAAAAFSAQDNNAALLLDTFIPGCIFGGTGQSFDWSVAKSFLQSAGARGRVRIILAGGLASDNVATAVRTASPWCVDASSRLESSPGKKDIDAVRRYIEAARDWRKGI